MNNARVNCPKCQKMFPNQQLLIQHSRKCEKEEVKMDTTEKEDIKMDTTEKEETKSDGFKLEVKDPLGGENLENLQDQWVVMHISRDAFPPAGVAYKRALKSSLSLFLHVHPKLECLWYLSQMLGFHSH